MPVGDKLVQYDALAVNTIVKNRNGEVNSCDIRFNEDMEAFNQEYLKCFRYYLPISFQFHHTQMDGAHAGKFLQRLQDVIRKVG